VVQHGPDHDVGAVPIDLVVRTLAPRR
jgi:hypothetical protein